MQVAVATTMITIIHSTLRLIRTAILMSSVVKGRSLLPDIRFPHFLAKIVVRTTEAAVQYSGKCRFRIAGIGTGMLAAVFPHKKQQRESAGNRHHEKSRQTAGI